ncbi:DUF5990 family protein [Streptomyces sp. NBC_00019]|uniref:DUF5990 family protein n=1 Tax=Streptomyces sp. NBC_00019 TaxID=2975623 RepID=UPI003865D818
MDPLPRPPLEGSASEPSRKSWRPALAWRPNASELLIGRLRLTNAQGGPLCARVRPPHITWTAERAG